MERNVEKNVFLNELGIVCALGSGKAEVRANMLRGIYGKLTCSDEYSPGRALHIGKVTASLASVEGLPPAQRTRNNALLLTALAQIRPQVDAAIERYGASRVAAILGTSTSGIAEGEAAIRELSTQGQWPAQFHYAAQELCSPALALTHVLQLTGPAYIISTACSSSAKALASAARLLMGGSVDAVLVGGVDSLCAFTIAGFSALETVSPLVCNPMSLNRNGINIGEAAALFLMSREKGAVRLAGWGESSDAYHMSAPLPDGRGASDAMAQALARAAIDAAELDYINLHGTATLHNDAMESRAIETLCGTRCAASSSKPLTGHTLGAAGALEAGLCWLSMVDNPRGDLIPHWWDGARDPQLPPIRLTEPGLALGRPLRYALSNSFAFGGSNASLLLAASAAI